MSEKPVPPFIPDPEDPNTIIFDLRGLPDDPRPDEPEAAAARKALKKLNKATASRPKRRTRGGQPGNNNAVKYGFYARRLPNRDLDGLDETKVTSLKDEIEVMRVFSRKVAELGSGVDDLDEATGLLRVLSLATSSINRLVRTHTRIPDPALDPALLLRTALEELEEEWPELKAFGDQFRNKPDTKNNSYDQP